MALGANVAGIGIARDLINSHITVPISHRGIQEIGDGDIHGSTRSVVAAAEQGHSCHYGKRPVEIGLQGGWLVFHRAHSC